MACTLLQVTSPSLVSEVMGMPPITTPTYAKEFKKVIEAAARGRQICTVQVRYSKKKNTFYRDEYIIDADNYTV